MSKAIVPDQLWAEMIDEQKINAVVTGCATLKQMSQGLLDGSERLRRACQDSLAHLPPSLENLAVENPPATEPDVAPVKVSLPSPGRQRSSKKLTARKPRFGLPENFVPRLQRFGRGVLLELNIYRLPTGQEFIPSHPIGTLGQRQHLYALLTTEQYLKGQRGSVYVRIDGRIFDYSLDSINSATDFFDTGYTLYDLERTGHYAPPLRKRITRSSRQEQSAAAGNSSSRK
ncbi:MAG TPA: hypothetical protein VJV03_08875 [Pyrinomonadaceae bacterium]|nr:hypothetical protein [Pyrinomonadaceae bacterium]